MIEWVLEKHLDEKVRFTTEWNTELEGEVTVLDFQVPEHLLPCAFESMYMAGVDAFSGVFPHHFRFHQ